MPDSYTQLTESKSAGASVVFDKLLESLKASKDYHRLFDATLMRKKQELGLPLFRPTTLDDVPTEKRTEFEKTYVEAAREVGQLFLDAGQIANAWLYFRTIREPGPVAKALDAMPSRREPGDETEELIQVALFDGANPPKGVQWMLKTHGTCSTITSLEQQMARLPADDRKRCAAILVKHLYTDLTESVQADVQRRMALAPPSDSLREAIAGRDWLFQEGNYHIDVSHLNAVTRFARFLDKDCPELKLAIELTEYGSHLDPQFQYPGDPPFNEFYPAHRHFFLALAGEKVDEALAYFREKLDAEPDERDKQLIAYVLVDLTSRISRWDDAVQLAENYLLSLEESSSFSFAELCRDAGRMDVLQRVAQGKNDLVTFTAALLS
jgi:tetratricopeptide (TPR) repeat protein